MSTNGSRARLRRTGDPMTRVFSFASALVCAAGVLLSAQAQPQTQQPAQRQPAQRPQAQPPEAQQPQQSDPQAFRFRTGVELINVNATVTDQSGRFVSGLSKDDFRVFD